jgi:branched-chain amino acid transport system substrate-binding protein
MSGVVGYLFAPGAKAVSAWAAEVNGKGGINCHPVKHLIGDSGGDPARYQALVRQFVEREGVVTFVFNPDSFAAQAGADYLEQKQVPVIGGGGGEMFTYDKSMQFPVFGMGVPMQINQVFQASRVWVPAGKTKIGTVACVEAEYCPIFDKTVKEFGPKFGFTLAYQADVTITAPDYTANCLEARNSGVQAFITSLDGQTNQRLINSCAKVGFNVPIAAASIQGTDDFKDNPNMVGSLIGMNVAPWFGNTPAVVEHRTIFKKHVRDAIFGPAAINGWTTAKAFEAATRNIPRTGPVTNKDVLAGLYGLNGDDLGGLTYPLRFSASQPSKKRIACGYPVQVVAKGKWDAPIAQSACVPGFEP